MSKKIQLQKINPQIIEILNHHRVPHGDVLTYLVSLWFGYKAEYIPQGLIDEVDEYDIFTRDQYSRITWVIPLFILPETADPQENIVFVNFLKDYIKIFKDRNPEKRCSPREVSARMTELLKDPLTGTNMEEVLEVANYYVNQTDSRYIMMPHYFISKGIGLARTRTILAWIERWREHKEQSSGESLTRKLQ